MASAAKYDFTVDRGSDWVKTLTISDAAGDPVPITDIHTAAASISGTLSPNAAGALVYVSEDLWTTTGSSTYPGSGVWIRVRRESGAWQIHHFASASASAGYWTSSTNPDHPAWVSSWTAAGGATGTPVVDSDGFYFEGNVSLGETGPAVASFSFDTVGDGTAGQVEISLSRGSTNSLSTRGAYRYDWFAFRGKDRTRLVAGKITARGSSTISGSTIASPGGGSPSTSGVVVQDEGVALATTATVLNFEGAGVAVTGTGAIKTITISGGGDGGGGGDALTSSNLNQFADVTQTSGQTLAITSSTTLSGGTHSGTNTGDNAANSLYSGLVTNATHTGDVTGATALTIANDAVTYAKMQNVSAASKLLGRGSASGAGNVEEITLGSGLSMSGTTLSASGGGGDMLAANNLSDVASAATSRTNLGLGTLATQSGTFSGTSSGTNTGDQDLSGYSLTSTNNATFGALAGSNAWGALGSNSFAGEVEFDTTTTFIFSGTSAASLRAALDLESGTDFLAYPTGTPSGSKFLRDDNSWQTISGGGDALVANPLSQFAATTSSQLAGVISDETGSGALVFATSPTLVTPALGTPSSGTLNLTAITLSGTKAQFDTACSDGNFLYVGDVTTNATHTGDVTGSTALTLATVNSNVGAFGSATAVPTITVNAKGLITAASNTTIDISAAQVNDFDASVAATAALAANNLSDLANAATARTNLELATISQAEAEAGTATTTRAFTAQRVAQAIAALGGVGGAGAVDVQYFTASGTWTKPANARTYRAYVINGGHGGGSGRRGSTGDCAGGGGGGSPGVIVAEGLASTLSATETVTVGAGGAGGVGRSIDLNGASGSVGGSSMFGPWGAQFNGASLAGSFGTTSTGNGGGSSSNQHIIMPALVSTASPAGGAGNVGNGAAGGLSAFFIAGAGGGGGVSSADALGNGGAGGTCNSARALASAAVTPGGTGGVAGGASPTSGTCTGLHIVSGSGGGAGSLTDGQAGAPGTFPGGGGGGGGAGRVNSGPGGAGADGFVVVITYCDA